MAYESGVPRHPLLDTAKDVIALVLTLSRLQRHPSPAMILGTFIISDLLGFGFIHLVGLNDHMIRT